MEIEANEGQLQIHLSTKQTEYAVADTPYSIGANVFTEDLNTLVNTLLKENGTIEENVDFQFLVCGEYLRSQLGDHLREKQVSFEDAIEIEYSEKFPSPEPQDCLMHDDWVSAVKTCGNWILTGCYDNTINIWTTKGSHVLTIPGHTSPIKDLAWIFIDDTIGTFVSCSQDQTAMLWQWNIENNAVDCALICKGHERSIDCISVSPDKKRFATGSWDTMLKIWSADVENEQDDSLKRVKCEQGRTRSPIMTLQGHRESISGVQWMDKESLITSSWDHTMKVWDLNLEGIKSEITGNKSFFDISYSNLNGLIVAASPDKYIRLYDPRSNQGVVVKNTYQGHSQWVQSVCWSSDDEFLFISGSYDNQVKLWDTRSPKASIYDLIGHEDKVLDCDWSNPKYMVSGGSDNTVRIFKSRKTVASIK